MLITNVCCKCGFMFISSHRIDDAPLAKRMKSDGELSMLSVFTSTISCFVPAEKNDAIFVHIISVEIDFSAPPVFCAMNAKNFEFHIHLQQKSCR